MRLAALLFVVLLGVLPFANALGNGFLNWDDTIIILGQPFLRALSWENLWTIFSPWPAREEWLPLRDLTLALNFALGGSDPFGFVLGNVALHAAAAAAVFVLLEALGLSLAAAFLGGLLFACHAVHVESVTWLSARKDPLSSFLLVLALLGWIRFRGGRGGLIAPLVLFGAALLSKANAFIFPSWLFLYDLVYRRELDWRQRFGPLLPFAGLGLGHLLLYLKLTSLDGVIEPYPEGGLRTVLVTDLALIGRYLSDLLLPLRHQAIYELEFIRSLGDHRVLLAVLLALLLVLLALRLASRPWVGFAVGFFFVNLLPYLNLVPHGIYYAERYLYLPSIAYAILLGAGGAWVFSKLRAGTLGRCFAALALAAYFAGHLLTSWSRNEVWADSLSFWEHQARMLPGNPTPLLNLGETFELRGELEAAAAQYEKLLVDGRRVLPEAIYRLARVARRQELLERARELYERYVELAPADPRGRNNLAEVHLAGRETEAAIALWEALVRDEPRYLLARANLARALAASGRVGEARPHWEHIIARADLLPQAALVEEARQRLAQPSAAPAAPEPGPAYEQ